MSNNDREQTEYDIEEKARLAALASLDLLDSDPEPAFDGIVRAISMVSDCPIALVSLMERDRQWFKARCGYGASETSRDIAFCKHTVDKRTAIEVLDMEKDPRFSDHPFVRGEESIRYYLGIPIRGPKGEVVGTICAIDRKPRKASSKEVVSTLEGLAASVEHMLAARWLARMQQAKLETLAAETEKVVRELSEAEKATGLVARKAEKEGAPRSWINRLTHDFVSNEKTRRRNQWDVVLNAAVRGLRPLASSDQIKIDVSVEPIESVNPPVIFARVAFTLLQRALEFAEPKSKIELSLSRAAGFILLKVDFRGEKVLEESEAARWVRTAGGVLNIEHSEDSQTSFLAWFPTT